MKDGKEEGSSKGKVDHGPPEKNKVFRSLGSRPQPKAEVVFRDR